MNTYPSIYILFFVLTTLLASYSCTLGADPIEYKERTSFLVPFPSLSINEKSIEPDSITGTYHLENLLADNAEALRYASLYRSYKQIGGYSLLTGVGLGVAYGISSGTTNSALSWGLVGGGMVAGITITLIANKYFLRKAIDTYDKGLSDKQPISLLLDPQTAGVALNFAF